MAKRSKKQAALMEAAEEYTLLEEYDALRKRNAAGGTRLRFK